MKAVMILVCLLGLAGCSSPYIMSTKDGKMIATDSKTQVGRDHWHVSLLR